MKKTMLVAAIIFTAMYSNAQLGGLVDKATKTAAAAGFDVNKLTGGIMAKLAPALALTDAQKPKVTDAVTGFLAQKANILPLQASNPADYQQKQGSLLSSLKTKLTGILVKDQMNKFLGLKPASNSPANVLSQLFY